MYMQLLAKWDNWENWENYVLLERTSQNKQDQPIKGYRIAARCHFLG